MWQIFTTAECRISSRWKWYKNYKNRLRLAKVIVKNKKSRFFMVQCVESLGWTSCSALQERKFFPDPHVMWKKKHTSHKYRTRLWIGIILNYTTTAPQPFYGPFPGPPGLAAARRELLDCMVQGKISRGRHTDHPAGRHSIRTNQCLPPPSPIFLQAGCPSCRPTNSIKALRATSAFGLGRRR